MRKILIVDDSPFFRRLLKDELTTSEALSKENQLEIFEAEDKNSALLQVKNHKPELVLLDIVMRDNEKEGVQILETISKDYPSTKVIVVSSVGQNAIINRCKALGVKEYIEKPYNSDKLTIAIRNSLSENN